MEVVFALGKLSRQLLLSVYEDHLDPKTERLLKGFYTKNKHELKSKVDLEVDKKIRETPEKGEVEKVTIMHDKMAAKKRMKDAMKSLTVNKMGKVGIDNGIDDASLRPGTDRAERTLIDGAVMIP